MALERWYGEVKTIPEMNVHLDGTPDVPDIVHPGDWIVETDELGDVYSLVTKVSKHKDGEFDYCPGAESWTIHHLGIGYMTGERLSKHDCCFINDIVAVNGELLPLYKLEWNEETTIRVCQKPDDIEVPKEVWSLIRSMNNYASSWTPGDPLQLKLFSNCEE
jgi:hypothetical protein